jgi:hypothetical protein
MHTSLIKLPGGVSWHLFTIEPKIKKSQEFVKYLFFSYMCDKLITVFDTVNTYFWS